MAGILFLVAWGLIDFKEIAHTIKTSRTEFAIMVATFASTLFLTLEEAIIIGVLMSLSHVSGAHLQAAGARACAQSAQHEAQVHRRRQCAANVRNCASCASTARCSSAPPPTSAKNWPSRIWPTPSRSTWRSSRTASTSSTSPAPKPWPTKRGGGAQAGGGLYLIGVKDTVQEQLAESGALKTIGGANLFDSKTEAIAEIYRRLDRDVCCNCSARIFRECAPVQIETSGHFHPLTPAGAQP